LVFSDIFEPKAEVKTFAAFQLILASVAVVYEAVVGIYMLDLRNVWKKVYFSI